MIEQKALEKVIPTYVNVFVVPAERFILERAAWLAGVTIVLRFW